MRIWMHAVTAMGALAACTGSVSLPDEEPAAPSDATAVLPRLTTEQYLNSVRDLLGTGLPAVILEPDTNPYLFTSIGATTTTLSEVGVQQYEQAAHVLAGAVFGDPARRQALVGCAPLAPDDECARGFLARFGRRALRRPLSDEELARWLAVSAEAGAGGDPWRGLRIAVAGMLQSPHFLYRIELGESDPDDPDRLRYTGWEMASRLSFLLWNTTPDDALLAAAEAGDLADEGGVRTAAERLLADPRARPAVQSFFAQYLDLGRLAGVTRDTALHPTWTPTMSASMRREVELLVEELAFGDGVDARALFSTRTTFVNSELAALYGIEAPGATADVFVRAELPAGGPRAGLLTLGAFLAMNAHPEETAPTLRGKYLRERVLCELVPPPPQDFDIGIIEEGEEPRTMRERMEQHAGDPACAGCHLSLDPPGFLFEGFDAVGVHRTSDAAGNPVDTSGDLDGVPLADARALAAHLEGDPRVAACMVRQLYRHASGRLEVEGEADALAALTDEFAASGYQFRSLVLAMVASRSFRTVAREVQP
ncbi:MAG TPA: DUF1592 domain-containing protein [Kofleriaceae bacterium]|nr:DUF1592 domain-containing protein [Kofleriaceae bacterium]